MTPEEAWKNSNETKLIMQNSQKSAYAKGFKKRNRENFIKSQIVAITELPRKKENQRFGKTGEIIEVLKNDSYLIKRNEKN